MKERVSRKFKPSRCMYKLGDKLYISQPDNTRIKYYVRDDNDDFIAILGKQRVVLPYIAIIILILYILSMRTKERVSIDVSVPNMMYIRDGMLSLDLRNNSNYNIEYEVLVNNELIADGIVNPMLSESNIECTYTPTTNVVSGLLRIKYNNYSEEHKISITYDEDV